MTQQPAAMGHGVKQRDVIRMNADEIDALLQSEQTMQCATMNHDGTIHLVAMWYGFLEGAPALETKAKSQKVKNLRRNDQMSCLVETGDAYDQLRGVELVGHGEIVEDPDRMLALGISIFERTQGVAYKDEFLPAVQQMLNKRVVVKIHVDKYVSWDHRKLGLPPTG
ncbi:MAG TPA: pyridoxamine 5'-phosphate oxidase family protein [Acidimicrobiia bacterium]|jgi:nitroimidazol reductase NimA-like FMN-containing flavoprotein (pyridoxamine 5'-phosphate oxidase superfamily)